MRLTFLSHFVLCLGVAAAAWFAQSNGVFSAVYMTDASHMTEVIAVVFVQSVILLGMQAWRIDGGVWEDSQGKLFTAPGFKKGVYIKGLLPDAAFGHLAERLLPMLGLFGTAFGLSLQAKALSGGASSFGALATSLYCTASGVLAALIVAIMTFNLEAGIKRARR